jgi:6-pyruvoyltetrahydropterin/6-carboxytetrahydropterin synthase
LATWPAGHKCHRLHGHSYRVIITVKGKVNINTGAVMDFADISALWRDTFHSRFDHQNLNDVLHRENVTAEDLARIIYEGLYVSGLHNIDQVTVFETEDAWATYEGAGK